MNDELLLKLYETLGLQGKGNFETFKNDISDNPDLQFKAYNKLSEIKGKKGEFEQFQSDFGFGAKAPKSKPSIQFAPEQEALLDAISDVEAPDYNVIVGGGRFDDFSDHPRKVGVVTEYGPSTAAGRLQFTQSTWDEINKVLKLPDFSPDSQKIAGLYYAETRYKDLTGGRDIYEDLSAGRLETIQQVLGGSGGATVWQGLQGDTEFPNRYKSHLKRYQDQVKPPEPKTMQEAAQDLDSAMQGNKKMAESLQYNLGETTVEPTPKKIPEDMGKIKERLDQERVSLKTVDHDYVQKASTRQDELWGQFEQTPIAKSIQEKYATEYDTHFKKSEENVKSTPEFIGLMQKIQDDVNSRVITPDEGNVKLAEYLNEKISTDQSLSEIKLDIDGRLKEESLSVFQGYTSKDEILGSLLKQRDAIWSESTAFQTELINSYNSKIEDYNKQAQSQAQANQPKASKEVGLQGGGPYAPGQRPQDYTGGLIKINKTSSDYDKDLEELDSKVGLKKDAALAAWYTDQGREVPTQKSKDLTKKSTEYFKKGKEIKLKRYEALKQELFTMSPIELGRSKIEDFTQKVQEYGDVQRGYFEQDNVAVQAYADELVKFREGADLALSEKYGDRYDDFKEDQAAIEILIKSGADVKDKVKNFREKYKDIEEDDDHLLSSREIPKLYQQAKFEQSQLADAYQQGERLKRVEETQKYANENPVMAAIAGTLGKAIGAVTQTAGSLLEQAEKAPLLVKLIPGFAQLSGFLPKGSLEKGISELGEMGRVAGGDIKAGTPFSTKMQGQVNETFSVTPSGKRVVYSPNTGEVQYIRNEDGTLYEGYEADVIIKSAEGLKKQQALNPFSLIGQMLDIGAEMIPTIALSYGTAGAGAAAGLGSTGVGVMSKMGMFMGGYSQGYSQAKEEALKQKGLSFDQAEAFAVTTGLITGAVENFNPLEGRIFSKSLSKSVIKDNLLELASGRVSGINWADNITINFLKGGLKESLLEEVPQAFADNALKNYYNSKKGSEFVADVSSDQWKDIILTSFAMGGIGDAVRSGNRSDLGKEALKVLVNNREMYDAYISGMEKTSPEMAAKIRSDIDPLLSEIDSVEGLTPKRKERSVELLFDIRTLESKLAPIVEPTLRKPIEDQIVELRKELGSIVSVPTDDYGDPVDEVAEAEKAAKEAEKTKEKVSKPSTTPTPKKPEEPPTPPAPAAASVAVEETKPAETETRATFVETPKQSVGDTQTPEVGVESTQVEKVAPTQQADAEIGPEAQTQPTQKPFALSYANGKTTPAVKKDGKWFLPETGAKNEDGSFVGTFANEKQSKELDKVYGSSSVSAAAETAKPLTSERIVYDREPTADDGVYKILGDENNIIYRVNPETGRIQEYSDGFWSNTASNPIARGTARKEGFQKIADPSQKQDTEVNPTLKDVKSTNKALEELTEDQTEDVDDIASEYILSVASNKLNTIIEESGLPESIKKIIRKRFSLNEKGEYVSSIPFDKIVKPKDILRAKRFAKDVGVEKLKEKYNENTVEYLNELDKLNENIDKYFQSLFDAEQNGDVVKTSPEIASIVNIIDEIQDKFNEADNSTPKTTAEAYHQAKKEGDNPELVKAVEDLLGTKPAAEPKKTTPKVSKTDSEIKRVQDEIDYTESQIENLQEEIKTEKENLKEDIKKIRDKIAEVRASKMSKAAKEDRIEELKAEIEDLQDNYEGYVEQYKNDIQDNRNDLKRLNKELAKLQAKKQTEAAEPTPAAQTTTTKTKDKETTTTSTPIQTELENIGKTPKAIQEQIYKFFTSKIPGLPEDKARELAVSTYVMWDSIGRTLGGAKGIDFIQKKLAQIGQISTAKEATKMAKDAGGSVKFQDADMVKASKESDSITLEYDKDGKHLAPNGKPSNLTEQQAKIVRTPSFKKWFGEWETDPKNASKVVDENGEPLVVYHGTNTSFTEFDNKKKGSSTKAPDTNLGFFFAESREQALRYGENVLPSFLNIRNLGATGNLVNYFAQKNSINTLEYYRDNIDTVKENLGDFISSYWNLPKDFTIDDIQERINKEVEVLNRFGPIPDISGYDGLKTPMFKSKDVNQYIAFNSNQIKLADGTNQTFNPNTSDIRFQQDSTDPSLIEQVSRDIVNNAITHIEELIGKGKEKLRAEKDTAKRKDLQKSILSLQDTQNRLKKNLKDPKFSNDQKFRAAAIDLGNNTFILAALQDPTITSPSHEFFHAAIEGVMTPEEQQAFIEEYNKEFGDKATSWNKDVSEYTARTYEKYLSNGRKLTAAEVKDTATRNKLQKAFDNFTEWAKNLYNSVIEYNNSKGVTKPINLTPQAQAFFDRVTGINTQIQTTKDESIKSESKTSSKGEEGKVGTTVAQEQRKGLGEEVSTQEEVNTESLQTKDPTQKAAQDLVTDSKKTIDELSQDQAAAILDYMKGLKIDISGLKTDCKK